jgi:hypothetical protein
MFTLTIYFIALNVYIEFVLIYRPHPVHKPDKYNSPDSELSQVRCKGRGQSNPDLK